MSIIDASYGAMKDIFDHHILPKIVMLIWSDRLRYISIQHYNYNTNTLHYNAIYKFPQFGRNVIYKGTLSVSVNEQYKIVGYVDDVWHQSTYYRDAFGLPPLTFMQLNSSY